jgi:hypothetical protein
MTLIRTRASNAVWHIEQFAHGYTWCHPIHYSMRTIAYAVTLATLPETRQIDGVPICGRCMVVWRRQGTRDDPR